MILTDIKLSLANLRNSKIRSLLTMLGIVIGVASVLIIISLGNGVKEQVNSQINSLGNDYALIVPGHNVNQGAGQIPGLNLTTSSAISNLSPSDIEAIQSIPGIKGVSGSMSISGNVTYGKSTLHNTNITGVSDNFLSLSGRKLAKGQFFDTVGNSNTVVIGESVSQEFFGSTNDPIAKTLTIRGKNFIVVGVTEDPAKDNLISNQLANGSIYIPLAEAKSLNHDLAQLQNIVYRVNEPSQINRITSQVETAILKNHKGQRDFSIIKQDEIIKTSSDIIEILTGFIAVIASISLLVGGIGIMNVMIAGVTERTREIGIRKSIGATNSQIWLQFLIEAAVLSLVGGLIGIGVALGVTYGLQDRIHITPVFDWQIIALAAGISIVIGIIFGVAPAIQAARKDPIESLRYE